MKTHTSEFKNQIAKLGREIDFKIFLHTNDKIITENGKFLMTQDNFHLVVEQFEEEEVDEIITSEDIYNATISNKGNLLSTMMKEFDFETSKDLRIGDVIDCSFGLKVNGEYEYINYGRYMIYSKEFNEDTKTYSYIAYDKMLLTMQEIPDTVALLESDLPIVQLVKTICEIVGLNSSEIPDTLSNPYPNLNIYISVNTFKDLKMTYRDILDQICQALGVSMIVDGNKLKLKPLNQTAVDTIDENYLKNINVSFGEKYGPINSVVLSRSEDNDNIYKRDEESIALNGLHEFKIKDNLILLQGDRDDYINEIFDQLNGVEFYLNDFSSTGITYLDWLDFYNISIGDKTYKCLMLDDEIKISQGLEESVYTEMPSEAENESTTIYKTSGKTDKEVSFIVDKQNADIKGTVQKDNIIASLNLAVENGQGIVNLVGNTVTIESDNFTLNAEGDIEANSGLLGDIMIKNGEIYIPITVDYNYTNDDLTRIQQIITHQIEPTEEDYLKYDFNGDRTINSNDLQVVVKLIKFGITIDNPGKILFKANKINSGINIVGGNGLEFLKVNFTGVFINNQSGQTTQITQSGVYTKNENNGNQTSVTPNSIVLTDGTNTKTITATN